MRTLQFDLRTQLRAVVPEQFILAQIEAARADDRTPFQAQLIEKYDSHIVALENIYPTGIDKESEGYDAGVTQAQDDFLLELLSNGLRKGLRGHVIAMLESSGLGGTVAPVEVLEQIALVPEKEVAVES